MTVERPPRPVVVYDGDCGMCDRAMRWLRDRSGDAMEYLARQELGDRVPQVDRDATALALHLVRTDGTVSRGARAVLEAMTFAPGHGLPWLLYRHVPLVAPVAERVYAWIAAHRQMLSCTIGPRQDADRFVVSRRLFQVALAAVTVLAFGSFWQQSGLLIGENGIWPVAQTMAGAAEAGHGITSFPTLFWWLPAAPSLLCAAGIAAALALGAGWWPRVAALVAWACWASLTAVSGEFHNHPGDRVLGEALLLSALLAARGGAGIVSGVLPVPRLLLLALAVRAVVVPAWTALTGEVGPFALGAGFWTQPMPSPIGVWFGTLPGWLSNGWALVLAVVALLGPWLLFGIGRARRAGVWIVAVLQVHAMLVGAQGLLPLLVLALLVLAVPESRLPAVIRRRWAAVPIRGVAAPGRVPRLWLAVDTVAVLLAITAFVPALRLTVAAQLQATTAFESLGVVVLERPELEVQGSDNGTSWHPFAFPGQCAPHRAPVFCIGVLPRIGWQLHFAADDCSRRQMPEWLGHFALRLLQDQPQARDAGIWPRFRDGSGLLQVRFVLFRQRPGDAGIWWQREELGPVGNPFQLGG